MSQNTLIALVMVDTKAATERAQRSGATLPEQFRAACEAAHDHWMVTDPDEQFRGACAGFLEANPDHREEILAETRVIGRFAALLNAAQAGLSIDVDSIEPGPENPIGLLGIWREVAQ